MNMSFPNSPPRSETSTIDSDISESIIAANSKKYNRISVDTRDSLLAKIFFENKKIKIAAKELNMNYSTAKTILHLYRKKQKKAGKKIKEENRCLVQTISNQNNKNLEVIVTQGGKIMHKTNNMTIIHKTIMKPKIQEDEQKYLNYQCQLKLCLEQYKLFQKVKELAKKAEIKPSHISPIKTDAKISVDSGFRRNVIIIKPILQS